MARPLTCGCGNSVHGVNFAAAEKRPVDRGRGRGRSLHESSPTESISFYVMSEMPTYIQTPLPPPLRTQRNLYFGTPQQ